MKSFIGGLSVWRGRGMQVCADTLTLTRAHGILTRHTEGLGGAHARPSDSPMTIATAAD